MKPAFALSLALALVASVAVADDDVGQRMFMLGVHQGLPTLDVGPGQALPAYDVDRNCRGDISTQCVYYEQQAYNNLKVIWPLALNYTKDLCVALELLRSGAMKYTSLNGCMATWAADRNDAEMRAQGKFKP